MTQTRFTAINTLQYLVTRPTIQTMGLRRVQKVLSKTLQQSSMCGLIGEEGIGKSTAAAKYLLSTPNTYYIRMGQSYAPKALFTELIFVMTGKEVYNTVSMKGLIDFLSEELTATPEKKLIVIDDAGKLKSGALGLFHELRDNTMGTVGFAFMGPQYFIDNLLKWRKEKKIGIGEFYRRVNYWYSIPHLTEPEKVLYLKSRGIELNEKVRAIMRAISTIWELEARINIYLEQTNKKNNAE